MYHCIVADKHLLEDESVDVRQNLSWKILEPGHCCCMETQFYQKQVRQPQSTNALTIIVPTINPVREVNSVLSLSRG